MLRTTVIVLCLATSLMSCKKELYLQNNTPSDDGPPPGRDGSGCTSDRRCDGELCLSFGDGWTGGYCSTLNCAGGCNGDDAACVKFVDGSSFCLDGCERNTDCRDGYRCIALDASGNKVCYRDDPDAPPAGSVGSDCGIDDDCLDGGICDADAPGGYCLGTDCGDCPDESVCAQWEGEDRCVSACDATRDCRIGYLCEGGACVPAETPPPAFGFEVTEDVLGVQCGAENLGEDDIGTRWRMTYEIPAGSTGYALVPFVKTGAIRPLEIGLPSGGTIDLVSDYKHHNVRIDEFQFFDQESDGTYGAVALDWPLIIPYSPERADLLEIGTHTVEVITTTSEPCLYALPTDGSGVVVDLNIIFMGLEGYSAAMAENDPDLTAIFRRVDTILAPAGLGLGEVRYFDAPRELSERYSRIRDQLEIRRATAFGAPRDETLSGHLSVDMFLVEDLGPQVLGLSAGLPGPPGLHGNAANGLVFTGADIGSANDFVAHIMAHELGHYAGLRHTTETVHNREAGVELEGLFGTTDPIEDTPVCVNVDAQGYMCPDGQNLMFAYAPAVIFTPVISAGQAAALRANPLFKAAE